MYLLILKVYQVLFFTSHKYVHIHALISEGLAYHSLVVCLQEVVTPTNEHDPTADAAELTFFVTIVSHC